MGMDDRAPGGIYAGIPKLKLNLHEGASSNGDGIQELDIAMKVLTRVDLDLSYSSDKLGNLHVLLMNLLALENDLEAMAVESSYVVADSIEKALVFDLLSSILDSEVRELESFVDIVQAEIVDASHKISSSRHLRVVVTTMEEKLYDSEESLKQIQKRVLEVKMQSIKFQRSLLAFGHEKWKCDESVHLSENGQLSNVNAISNVQTAEQQNHILRMLEKSLGRELNLENKLSECGQNEEDLRLKLHHTEQVAFRMEEAAEVVWGRFLEAENTATVLTGISKELLAQIQVIQFGLSSSIQREGELKSKLQDCIGQLKAKDAALEQHESSSFFFKERGSRAAHMSEDSEVFDLREKVKLLEERLKESEFQLKYANVSNAANQGQLIEMENIVNMLKESMYEVENRAESAETKVTQLTETNLELSEELSFLKSRDDKTEKVTKLENHLRELQIQLQHAKASSEASQEQQNMLYSAIWDMETLIEDLKSKVAKAEGKAENTEEQCILMFETNFELNKEISFLKDRIECLETSLDQANNAKLASAKEINVRAQLIKDMMVQLATERERLQKQLSFLTKQNKSLVKLTNAKSDPYVNLCDNEDGDDKELLCPRNGLTNATSTTASEEAVTESLTNCFQVDETLKDAPASKTESRSPISANSTAGMNLKPCTMKMVEAGHANLIYFVIAIVVLLCAVGAMHLFNKKFVIFDVL